MTGIGIVGIGFMGMIHYLASRRVEGAKVVALCSRDPKKLAGDWTSIQGNFGPRGTQMDLSGIALYDDYASLLADPQVDLVDLCVPNELHGRMAIQALRAGKPVLVEKPIALSIDEADAMVAAAREAGKPLMVGHVLPFVPEFAFAVEAVRSGRYGAIRAAHFTRVISRPDWSSEIADPSKSGGPAIDLHIHDTHFIGLLCGVPRAVHSRGVVENGAVVHLTTQYLFDAEPGGLLRLGRTEPGRPAVHAWFRALPRRGDDRLRVRQSRRAGASGDAAVGDPARRDGRTAGARDRGPGRWVRPGAHGRHGGGRPRPDRAAARGRPGATGPFALPGRGRERADGAGRRVGVTIIIGLPP